MDICINLFDIESKAWLESKKSFIIFVRLNNTLKVIKTISHMIMKQAKVQFLLRYQLKVHLMYVSI